MDKAVIKPMLAAILIATMACAPTESREPAGALVQDDARLRDLLADSWMSDGRRGFFIEDAWSPARSPFSLYDTHWNLRLAEFDPGRAAGLDPARVSPWLAAAQDGRLGGQPIAVMTQLNYAVGSSVRLGIKVATDPLATAVESLRAHDRYRSATNTAPDWGNTALALETLAAAKLFVPDPVISAVRDALNRSPVSTAAEAVDSGIPQLRAAAVVSGAGLSRRLLEDRVASTATILRGAQPDVVWLGAFADLRSAARSLGVPVPEFPVAACSRLARADGTVGLPGASQPDPQLTYYARSVGCSSTLPPSAHSRAGWPVPEAIDGALKSTVAGLWLATSLGVAPPATVNAVRTTLAEVWAAPGAPIALTGARLRTLEALLGIQPGAASSPPAGQGDDLGRLLAMVNTYYQPDSPARRETARGLPGRSAPTLSILDAAADELSSRILSSRELHDRAVATTKTLRNPNGSYSLVPSPGGSMIATVLATWITRSSLSVDTWIQLGMCSADRCADTPHSLPAADNTSLEALALTRACQHPNCDNLIPLIL